MIFKKMNSKLFFFFHIIIIKISFSAYNEGDNWAVLACGSTGYLNYRHQADIYHVYHTLLNRGFSQSHIILFAYDDIAYNPKNPFPGEVYNRPDGPNVYDGIIIDYSSNMVTPDNYLSVLKGDNKNGKLKKVLNSTKDDNIFLYFSDHGINGAMVFPDNNFLYADELKETFEIMQEKKMYKNIIYYMESCYSGSMFIDLNPDLNIYSITAASPEEESLATYCYPDDHVKGREMHTCLSNEFTSNWLDDIDKSDFDMDYSSREQFNFIKSLTKNSHVQEYGNFKVGELPITMFQSSNDNLEYIDKEKKEEIKKDDLDYDYDDIIGKLLELEEEEENLIDDNDIDNDYNINFNSLINNKNEQHNFINYIVERNKMKKNEKNMIKIKSKEKKTFNLRGKKFKKKSKKIINSIPSKNVKLYYLEVATSKNPEKKQEFHKEIEETYNSEILFKMLKAKLNMINIKQDQKQKIDFKCLRFSIQLFKDECSLNERDLIFISSLSDICSNKDVNLDDIKFAIIDVCKNRKNKKFRI